MNNSATAGVRWSIMGMHCLVVLALAACPLAAAEPPWQQELTSLAPGPYPAISPSVLDLQVSWKGMIESGKLRMEMAPPEAKKPGACIVRSSAASLGLAAVLFPYQNNFWTELDPVSLKPRLFNAVETDSEETDTSTTRYFNDRVEWQKSTKTLSNGKISLKTRVFNFSPVYDIFSAMLVVRSQKLADGDHLALVIQPFDTPYLLRVKVLGRELHLERKTIRLSVGMRKIDRKTLALQPYKKMKTDATLWLSDDAERIPVELRAAIFIGDIRATLTGYQKL